MHARCIWSHNQRRTHMHARTHACTMNLVSRPMMHTCMRNEFGLTTNDVHAYAYEFGLATNDAHAHAYAH